MTSRLIEDKVVAKSCEREGETAARLRITFSVTTGYYGISAIIAASSGDRSIDDRGPSWDMSIDVPSLS